MMMDCPCGREAVVVFFGWALPVRQPACPSCWMQATTASHNVSSQRLQRYDITMADYATILVSQQFACDICQLADNLVIDHDHDSGDVRGLLCSRCNSALGLFGDLSIVVEKAAEYLHKGGTLGVKSPARRKNLDQIQERTPLAIDQFAREVEARKRQERRRRKAAERMKVLGAKANPALIRAATTTD